MRFDKCRILSGNALKIIAALSMLLDHVGLMFFPKYVIFRYLGRLAFPIFSFMIAEGCRYTRNKIRYFLSVFLLGALCQSVYFIYDGSMYLNVLITFSIAILVIYSLELFKRCLFSKKCSAALKVTSGILFVSAVAGTYLLNRYLTIDYGFFGCMLPVFASLFHIKSEGAPQSLKKLDRNLTAVCSMATGILCLALVSAPRAYFSFFAVPLLLLYSGKRGRLKMKYFFYVFYPLHLVALEGVAMLLQTVK